MKAKVIILFILIVLFTIFVSQNTKVITVKAYFWEFPMSIIVLISLTGLIGVIFGFIIAKFFDKSEDKKDVKSGGKSQEERSNQVR
jgi:uncharacterized integral membrane protein